MGGRNVSTAPSSARAPSASSTGGRARATFPMMPSSHATDAVVRSREVNMMALFERGVEEVPRACVSSLQTRSLSPSRTTSRKLPKAKQRQAKSSAAAAAAEAASSGPEKKEAPKKKTFKKKTMDWEQQEALWTNRQERLKPYQRVEVEYIGPGGTKVKATGTLVRGWRVPNKACDLPHSKPPSSLELRLSKVSKDLKDERPWLSQAEKANDEDNYVIVDVSGVEKVLPREWIKPLSSVDKA